MIEYANTETTMKAWLTASSVAPLVTRPDGGISIYNAMPSASPIPSVICFQVTGGPVVNKDFPEQQVRMQIDCWGTSRAQASEIALQVIAELDNVARTVGPIVNGVYLAATARPMMRWFPDPESDTPRFIVDAFITTVA